jgi:hemolysin activation/secretion protein
MSGHPLHCVVGQDANRFASYGLSLVVLLASQVTLAQELTDLLETCRSGAVQACNESRANSTKSATKKERVDQGEMPCKSAQPIPADQGELSRALVEGRSVPIERIRLCTINSEGKPAPLVFPLEKVCDELTYCQKSMLETEHLVDLRKSLTRLFYNNGYVNSGAIIPHQVVRDREITVVIVQGRLSSKKIIVQPWPAPHEQADGGDDSTGRTRLKLLYKSYIKDRLVNGVKDPLDIKPLQERLQLLLQDQAIDDIRARLGPGDGLGDARLNVWVREAPRFQFDVEANNDRPVSVGEYQGVLEGRARSVFGIGDPLLVSYSLTEGLNDAYFAYELPLVAELPFASELPFVTGDLRFLISGEITDASVVEQPFDVLDIESETETMEIGFRYPIYRAIARGEGNWAKSSAPRQQSQQRPTGPRPADQQLSPARLPAGEAPDEGESRAKSDGSAKDGAPPVWERELALELRLARRHSETYLRGRPFSFSPGVQDGESDVTALRFVQSGFVRSENLVFQARSTFSFGLEAFGATVNENAPDSKYLAWLGQVQYAQRIPLAWLGNRNSQVLVRADLQLADEPLLPIEQFSVGGLSSVRGYPRNQLVRDNGWVASVQWRIPIHQVPIPSVSRTPEDGWIWLVPFFDAGGGWNTDRATPEPRTIYSVGAGIQWRASRKFAVDFYYGYPLADVPDPEDEGLQGQGIYFSVRVGFDFDAPDIAQFF